MSEKEAEGGGGGVAEEEEKKEDENEEKKTVIVKTILILMYIKFLALCYHLKLGLKQLICLIIKFPF